MVCTKCNRWNLSPLESRWEAIEAAERLFRATKMRVATDNIGLAKLADGTELVRVGKPPEIELAVWRYGEQFRKRYLKHQTVATAGVVVFSTAILAGTSGLTTGDMVFNGLLGIGVSVGAGMAKGFTQSRLMKWYNHSILQVGVRDNAGSLLRLTQDNIDAARLAVIKDEQWELSVPHVTTKSAERWARLLRRNEEAAVVHEPSVLQGPAALQALAMLLPRANREGANEEGVTAALTTIEQTSNLSALLRLASDERLVQPTKVAPRVPAKNVSNAPAHVRLALEMSLHADDERRAMDGELHLLEQRWRDADAIAKIADGLLLPADIDEQVNALRKKE